MLIKHCKRIKKNIFDCIYVDHNCLDQCLYSMETLGEQTHLVIVLRAGIYPLNYVSKCELRMGNNYTDTMYYNTHEDMWKHTREHGTLAIQQRLMTIITCFISNGYRFWPDCGSFNYTVKFSKIIHGHYIPCSGASSNELIIHHGKIFQKSLSDSCYCNVQLDGQLHPGPYEKCIY